jgi:flagellar hook protein FlgE
MNIAGIALSMTEGSTQSTSNPLDFAISGEGFFVVDMNGVLGKLHENEDGDLVQVPYTNDSFVFTRAGALALDADGYLVTQNGHRVVGVLDQVIEDEDTGEVRSVIQNPLEGDVTFSHLKISGEILEPVLDEFGDQVIDIDGNPVFEKHTLSNYKIDEKGFITAMTETGETRTIGRLLLATFPNSAGVEKIGMSYYRQSQNTGAVNMDFAGEGRGVLKSGALEMSNVDLANELTNMIITQRSYQANSRVITTSDTLLEELINLKR